MNGVSAEVIGSSQATTGENDSDAELGRLEALLAERARALGEQRAEVARLRALLNGALERFDTVIPQVAPPAARRSDDGGGLQRERDAAVARALEAEVARVEARFLLDQALGHLSQRGGVPASTQEGERLDVAYARLSGTVRGLSAALAETEEGRDTSDARLLLLEHDLSDARIRARVLERELAEVREQLELQQVGARKLEERFAYGLSSADAGALRGEHDGLRARCEEAERALATLRASQAAQSAERAPLQSKISELQQAIGREIENRQEVVAELGRSHAERMVLADELARAKAELASARAAEPRTPPAAAAAPELDAARASVTELRAEVARKVEALRTTRAQLDALSAALRALAATEDSDEPRVPTHIEGEEGFELQLAASEARARKLSRSLSAASEAVRELIASAPGNSVDVSQLAALRLLLSPGHTE